MKAVFAKTPTGEQAVQERTRLVQRNLRNVLIIVDGRTSVQGLCDRVGKPKVVESALKQLERDGYVVRIEAPVPSIAPVSVTGPASQGAASLPAAAAPAVSSGLAATPSSVGPSPFEPSPFAAPATVPPAATAGVLGGMFKSKPKRADDIKFSANDWNDSKISIKPIRRGRRRGPGLVGWLAIAALSVVVVLAVAALVFPYGRYQSEIERELSQIFGRPTKIGTVRGGFSGGPVLVLEQVEIGAPGEISLAQIRALLTPGSLFGDRRSFREVHVSGAKIGIEQLAGLAPGLAAVLANGAFSVKAVKLSGVDLVLRDLRIADLAGELAAVDEEGGATRLRLTSADGNLRLDLSPTPSALGIAVSLSAWKPVAASPFVWDSLKMSGTLAGNALVGEHVEGRLLDGVVKGQLRADWGAAGVALRADLSLEGASAKRVAEAFAVGLPLEGEINARLRVGSGAQTPGALRERATADGDFVVQHGMVGGIDFVEAVRRGETTPTRGGATRFDQLSGRYVWDGKVLRLLGLEGGTGAFRMLGSLSVSGGQKLAGVMDVRLRGSVTELRMPVTLSGTFKEPLVQGGVR